MYVPRHFAEEDTDILFNLIRDYSFGMLITPCPDTPEISHLPFIVDREEGPNGTLYGHFAKANPHWKHVTPEAHSIAVFQGPHSYISPNWYEDRSNVPTWNYAAVHVTGMVELVRDKTRLLNIVTRLTEANESSLPDPWKVENAQRNLEKMLGAIVGFRMPVEQIQGKFKLSQNKTVSDQRGAISYLDNTDDPLRKGVAELMESGLSQTNRGSMNHKQNS